MADDGLFPEPERTSTRTDGHWLVASPPSCWRYALLGEDDAEWLVVEGHGINVAGVRSLLRERTVGHGLTLEDDGYIERLTRRTWALALRDCPRHRWLPRWLRLGLVGAVDLIRHRCFRLAWRLWKARQDPLGDRRVPRWLQWAGRRWRLFSRCSHCEYVDHYRTCDGCGFCGSDGTGEVPPRWDWSTEPGEPADANRGKPGYFPVTVIDLEG